ncbi:hypothetical protein FQR65_LT03321 [Abscondita terminalis]|nr:hypothetical protein FQR65_LT03321 [Abscondita terminalis]
MYTTVCVLLSLFVSVELAANDKIYIFPKTLPQDIIDSWLELYNPIFTQCVAESGVNAHVAYVSIQKIEIANDPRLKCFFKCLFVNLNILEEYSGNFNADEMSRQINGFDDTVFSKCNEEVKNETDLCKKSLDMYLCHIYYLKHLLL